MEALALTVHRLQDLLTKPEQETNKLQRDSRHGIQSCKRHPFSLPAQTGFCLPMLQLTSVLLQASCKRDVRGGDGACRLLSSFVFCLALVGHLVVSRSTLMQHNAES